MCGINGIFAYHYAANSIDRAELECTRDYMAPRGPDGYGEWVSEDERIGFGHRRLAIVDLTESGAQPMSTSDGRYVVTFNGEIYNYPELRQNLEAKGYIFRSKADTEVLLHLYAAKGEAMLQDLRGMYAFAIWDNRTRELFLARDPYGIKPLYYADDGWTFRFASQVKALLGGRLISKETDPAGLVGFYLWGSVPEPFTTHRAIRTLPSGCSMRVDRLGSAEPKRFHSIARSYVEAERAPVRQKNTNAAREELRAALLDSVKHHLMADVPVGAFLSAGVDSGALVGLMRDAGQDDIQTVTLAFEEFRNDQIDEAPLAEETARQYGTKHTTRVVTRAEFQSDLPRLLHAMDQPSIDGVNSWFVCKAARELGLKVAVSGLGGDELLGGYPSFKTVAKWVPRLAPLSWLPGVGRALSLPTKPIGRLLGLHPKTSGALELGGTYTGAYLLQRGLYMPWELETVLGRDVVEAGFRRLRPLERLNELLTPKPRSAFARVATLEASQYMRNQLLRDADWTSMAHSLEVRVPLVDSCLLRESAAHVSRHAAVLNKRTLATAPSKPLPQSIINRSKTGFGTPALEWMFQRQEATSAERRTHTIRKYSQLVFQANFSEQAAL